MINKYEFVEVGHSGIHDCELSQYNGSWYLLDRNMRVVDNYEETFCPKCGTPMLFKRVKQIQVCVHHNNELGKPLWSVCTKQDFDNWIESYDTLEQAIEAIGVRYDDKVEVICSINGCKENHGEN